MADFPRNMLGDDIVIECPWDWEPEISSDGQPAVLSVKIPGFVPTQVLLVKTLGSQGNVVFPASTNIELESSNPDFQAEDGVSITTGSKIKIEQTQSHGGGLSFKVLVINR